ncbi:Cilia- and flagella-associated protein 44, partial [Cladochytrium tenue]
QLIAIGEVYYSAPAIFLLEYPALRILRVLRGGAARGYSNLCFNAEGDKLASVACDPDYMLTLWDWAEEKIILRINFKLAAHHTSVQDVYKVEFAPGGDGNLTTAGMGHIKFWRMASTFTGIKLQGFLGKFGASELTDIAAFLQLPDGKVLSSTETGNLLLWDGGFIKCELSEKGRKPCHDGRVEQIMMVENEVYTAGEDGFVRVWDFETIDNAEGTAAGAGAGGPNASSSGPLQPRIFEMEFLDEFQIGKDVKIKTLARHPTIQSEYLVQDAQGFLFRLDVQKRSVERLLSFHSGAIAAADCSPLRHSLLSLGSDGTLRLHDYIEKRTLMRTRFSNSGTVLTYLPEPLDGRGCTFAAGFSDGVLRIMSHQAIYDVSNVELKLHFAFKPHKGAIVCIGFSQDGAFFATGGEDKTVFFFKVAVTAVDDASQAVAFSRSTVHVTPIGFVELDSVAACVSFSPDNHLRNLEEASAQRSVEGSQEIGSGSNVSGSGSLGDDEDSLMKRRRVLITQRDGALQWLTVPSTELVDTRVSFQMDTKVLDARRWRLETPQPKREEGEPKDGANGNTNEKGTADPIPAPATAEGKANAGEEDDQVRLLSALRRSRGLVVTGDSPVSLVLYLEVHRTAFCDLKISPSGKYLIAGTIDGMAIVRKLNIKDMMLKDWKLGHETYEHQSKALQQQASDVEAERRAVIENSQDSVKDESGTYWLGQAHDCDKGRLNSVMMSFDDALFCSAGGDGGLFVWRVTSQEIESNRGNEPLL